MRRATPNAAKVAAGTYRPGTVRIEPRYVPEAPKPPADLSPVARKKWLWLVPKLHAMKLLTAIDCDVLELYCETHADYKKSLKVGGKPFSSAQTTQYRMLMAELGLTPYARLHTPPVVEDPAPKSWQPSDAENAQAIKAAGSKVVRMSAHLSNIAKTLGSAKSKSAVTSEPPATDK